MTNLPETPEPTLSARETAELATALLGDGQLRQAWEVLGRRLAQDRKREATRMEQLFHDWTEAGRPGDFFGWRHGRKTRAEVETESRRVEGEAFLARGGDAKEADRG